MIVLFELKISSISGCKVLTPWIDLDNNTNINTVLDMGHLLQALIGCPALPSDIPNGLMTFDHESKGLTTINTCGPSINFTRINEIGDYDRFQSMMKSIIVDAYGFGMQ